MGETTGGLPKAQALSKRQRYDAPSQSEGLLGRREALNMTTGERAYFLLVFLNTLTYTIKQATIQHPHAQHTHKYTIGVTILRPPAGYALWWWVFVQSLGVVSSDLVPWRPSLHLLLPEFVPVLALPLASLLIEEEVLLVT